MTLRMNVKYITHVYQQPIPPRLGVSRAKEQKIPKETSMLWICVSISNKIVKWIKLSYYNRVSDRLRYKLNHELWIVVHNGRKARQLNVLSSILNMTFYFKSNKYKCAALLLLKAIHLAGYITVEHLPIQDSIDIALMTSTRFVWVSSVK